MQAKICGITTVEAVVTAAEYRATMIGLVFYPPSPRFVSLETAQEIVGTVRSLPDERRPQTVGLFVNLPVAEMQATADTLNLDFLQLSGDETPTMCWEASQIRPILKSLRLPNGVTQDAALELVKPFGNLENVTLLLDTPKQGFYGGTGEVGNWQNARVICQNYRTMLAGGLTPTNVRQAIELVQPWGVDVSSGVEVDGKPGIKDLVKIKDFLLHTRNAVSN